MVLDIGTGDGRYVLKSAPLHPDKFFIGIDANAKPLAKASIRLERKPSKGGAPNAMFVQSAVEDLPEEFTGIATEIHIQFPWGSLLKAVLTAESVFVAELSRLASDAATLEIVVGLDPVRDATEIDRLGIAAPTPEMLRHFLLPRYDTAGFGLLEFGILAQAEWSALETTWARTLQASSSRKVMMIRFRSK